MIARVAVLMVAAAVVAPRLAQAERMGVLILPADDTDAGLAENLTEILIARIAEARGSEIVTAAALRRRVGLETHARAQACFEDIACMGRVGVSLGVRRVITGTVRSQQKQFLLSLTLTDIETGRVDARFFRLVQGAVPDLIKAAQEGADELFRPKLAAGRIRVESTPEGARVTIDDSFVGTTPLISGPLVPGTHSVRVEMERRFPWKSKLQVLPDHDLEVKLGPEQLAARHIWPSYVAYGSLGGSAIALSVGIVFGLQSQTTPDSTERASIQQGLQQRQDLARMANISFATAGALALTSIATFVLFRREIFGD
jgi:hypothetical protein